MEEVPIHWPKKGDRPFAPAVLRRGSASIEAFVIPADDGLYTVGYQRAADMIVDASNADDNLDDLLFPVGYLYRHHLELMLKGLVDLSLRVGALPHNENAVVGEPCPECGHRKRPEHWRSTHNLCRLWNMVRPVLEIVDGDSAHADVKTVESVIAQFNSLDKTGQAFRYARGTDGRRHLDGNQRPKRVDLAELKRVVASVSNFLDAAHAAIDAGDPGSPYGQNGLNQTGCGRPLGLEAAGDRCAAHRAGVIRRLCWVMICCAMRRHVE